MFVAFPVQTSLRKKFHPKEFFRAGKTLQKFGYSSWDKCKHLFSNLHHLLSETECFGNNVKNSDIALYSGYYVQTPDNIEKKYWWICIENTQGQMKNGIFQQSHSAEKPERGLFEIFKHLLCSKISKTLREGPLVQPKNFRKKSHSAEKNPSEKHPDSQSGDP